MDCDRSVEGPILTYKSLSEVSTVIEADPLTSKMSRFRT